MLTAYVDSLHWSRQWAENTHWKLDAYTGYEYGTRIWQTYSCFMPLSALMQNVHAGDSPFVHEIQSGRYHVRQDIPGKARTGSGATKAAASGGSNTVWSSGLCKPDTSLASMRLMEMPAEHLKPTSACNHSPHGP